VRQVLAAGKAPELERQRISRGIGIGIDLDYRGWIREPVGVRVACIARGVFQQAQAPAKRLVLRTAPVALPGMPVFRVASQVFPSQCGAVQMQDVQVCCAGMPVNSARICHGETSSRMEGNQIDKVADNGPGIRTICDSVAPLLY
jgi:hypothetical protein